MTNLIPFFAGFITLLFSIAFSYAITDGWNFKNKNSK